MKKSTWIRKVLLIAIILTLTIKFTTLAVRLQNQIGKQDCDDGWGDEIRASE